MLPIIKGRRCEPPRVIGVTRPSQGTKTGHAMRFCTAAKARS